MGIITPMGIPSIFSPTFGLGLAGGHLPIGSTRVSLSIVLDRHLYPLPTILPSSQFSTQFMRGAFTSRLSYLP